MKAVSYLRKVKIFSRANRVRTKIAIQDLPIEQMFDLDCNMYIEKNKEIEIKISPFQTIC